MKYKFIICIFLLCCIYSIGAEKMSVFDFAFDLLLNNEEYRSSYSINLSSNFVDEYSKLLLVEVLGEDALIKYNEQLIIDKGKYWFVVFHKLINRSSNSNIKMYEHDDDGKVGLIIRKVDGTVICISKF